MPQTDLSQTDLDYFRRRERQHRDRAETCAEPSEKSLHGRFADGYAARVRALLVLLAPAI